MKARFVADGAQRLKRSAEFQSELRALRERIHAKYAVELKTAPFFRRCLIRWRILVEYRRERRRIIPAARALYVANGDVGHATANRQ